MVGKNHPILRYLQIYNILSPFFIIDSCASKKYFFLKYRVSSLSYKVDQSFLPVIYQRLSPTIVKRIDNIVTSATNHHCFMPIKTITDTESIRSDGNNTPKKVPVSIILDTMTNIKIPLMSSTDEAPELSLIACCSHCVSQATTVHLIVL
jgi:hypothetical protein